MDVSRIIAQPVFAQTGKLGGAGALGQQVATAMDLARCAAQGHIHDQKHGQINGQAMHAFVALLSCFGKTERETRCQADRTQRVESALLANQRHGELSCTAPRNVADYPQRAGSPLRRARRGANKGKLVDQFNHEARQITVIMHIDTKGDRFSFLGPIRPPAYDRQTSDQPVWPGQSDDESRR